MAKVKTYLRIAANKRGYTVSATTRPNYDPIVTSGYDGRTLPTVAFAIELNIPDELFAQAEKVVASIDVSGDKVKIAGKVATA